jgi:hypothetical protein
MPTREELHILVDSLPEGAIEVVHGMLSRLQTWPPTPPPNAASGMQVRRADGKAVMSRMERWQGDTFISEVTRNHRGHQLQIVERICVDGSRLLYKHEVTSPGNKRDEREVSFDIPTA